MDVLVELGGFGGLTAGGIILITVLLIIRGDIVSRKVHEEVRNDRDTWKAAAEKYMEITRTQGERLDELMVTQKTIVAIAEAIQSEAESGAG